MKFIRNLLLSFLLCLFNASFVMPQQSVMCATDPDDIPTVGELDNVTWTLKILLVEFQDVQHKSPDYTYTNFNNLFFSNGVYASPNMYSPDGEQVYGSMRDYYSNISNGEFTLTGYVINNDSNSDGIPDWLALPHNKGQYDYGSYSFITDAFAVANSAGLNISTNSTTKLAIIYAGMTYRGGSLTPYAVGSYYIMGELFASGSPYREERIDAKFSEIGINAHEFGHLLGWPDLYHVDDFGNGRWDLMASGNYNGPNTRGACPAPPNPQLRADNGWLSFNNITQNQTVQADYDLNNPEIFQIKNSTDSENYWLIETRKFNSTMSIGSTNVGDYNTSTPHGNQTQGVLVWRYYGSIPTFLHASGIEWEWETTGPGYDGDPFPGSANVKVLSPWSDSETPTYNLYWLPNTKPSGNAGMEITGEGNGYYTLDLYYSDPEDASPSKPQNLQVASNGTYPVLTWDANTEPDISTYQVVRKMNSGSWTLIATISTNSYTDTQVITPVQNDHFYYKVCAKDNQNNYSVFSNEVSIDGYKIYKNNEFSENETQNKISEEFLLLQNYPNPFNPTTSISFSIPQDGYTTLKVYDILGKEVAVLAEGPLSRGNYSFVFDAGNLTSGLYFYRLVTSNNVLSGKMLLMK